LKLIVFEFDTSYHLSFYFILKFQNQFDNYSLRKNSRLILNLLLVYCTQVIAIGLSILSLIFKKSLTLLAFTIEIVVYS